MRKIKTSRKKTRGKNMKKIFACLLSLSMMPVGMGGSWTPIRQVKAANETQQEVKNGFVQNEITTKIGQFDQIKFKDSNTDVSVSVDNASKDKIHIYKEYSSYKGENVYYLEPQEEGDATVTATFKSNSGDTYSDKLTVHIIKDDSLVPFKSYNLYKSIGIYHDDSEEPWSETADVNKDNAISKDEIKNASCIDINGGKQYAEDDLEKLSLATNCKEISIYYCTDIKNVNFARTMTQLKIVHFVDTYGLSDISGLEASKDNLTYLAFDGTAVSAKDRFSFLRTKTINLEEGTEKAFELEPRGVLSNSDIISIEPKDAINVQQREWNKDELVVDAKDTKVNDTIKLILKDSKETAEYPISVKIIGQSAQNPEFEKTEDTVEIGNFSPIQVKDSKELKSIEVTSEDESVMNVGTIYDEENKKEMPYYVPQKEGETTLIGKFEKKDGSIYKKKLKVKVIKSSDENIMPITNFDLYTGIYDENGNHVDYNNDNRISKDEFSKIKEVYVEQKITDDDLQILNQLKTCENLSLTYDADLTNINFIKNMPNLKYLNLGYNNKLEDKDVDIINGIKDQLKYLNLSGTKVSFAKKMEFVNKNTIEVAEGESLISPIKPDGLINANTNISVEDPSVATLENKYVDDSNGGDYKWILTGKEGQEGKTTNIVIENSNNKDQESIKIPVKIVKVVPVTNIILNKTEATVKKGKNTKLIATCKPDNATDQYITWSSSNSEIASVSSDGYVYGEKVGTAEITATTNNGVKATCKVTVKEDVSGDENPIKPNQPSKDNQSKPNEEKPQTSNQQPTITPQKVEKITIKGISKNIAAGKKVKLTATATPENAANKSVTWTTSNKKVATVNASGVVSINKKAAGKSVTITAIAKDGSGKKASYKIKVMKGAVKKVKISGKKSVKAGKTLKLKAKVTASKGASKKLIWTSSNPKYATVSSSGKVKALKSGKKKSVKITAMSTDGSGKKATVTIKIK